MQIIKLILGQFEENCYLVFDEKTRQTLVIDPGFEAEKIVTEIQKQNLKPLYILNTHNHPDHTNGNSLIQKTYNIPLAAHRLDAPQIAEVDRLLEDGDTISVAGVNLDVMHTPGHTPGSICLWEKEKGVLFSGDTLFNMGVGRTDLPGGNWEKLMQSIEEKLFKLPPETIIYPGHGPQTTIGYEKENLALISPLDPV